VNHKTLPGTKSAVSQKKMTLVTMETAVYMPFWHPTLQKGQEKKLHCAPRAYVIVTPSRYRPQFVPEGR